MYIYILSKIYNLQRCIIFKQVVIIWLQKNETMSMLQFFCGLNKTGDKRLLAFQLVVSRLENYGAKLFMASFTIHSFIHF